jgi:hypothetical protein
VHVFCGVCGTDHELGETHRMFNHFFYRHLLSDLHVSNRELLMGAPPMRRARRTRRTLNAASGRARTGLPLLRAQQSQRSAIVGRLQQPVTSRAQSSSSAGEGTGVCVAGGGADRCGAVRHAALASGSGPTPPPRLMLM